ncbi:hypothetical protein RJ641_018006 [Dillenia turbinata]
MPLLCQ